MFWVRIVNNQDKYKIEQHTHAQLYSANWLSASIAKASLWDLIMDQNMWCVITAFNHV